MSLMSDLLETYNVAYDEGLVDDTYLNNDGLVILPIYHSSRNSSGDDVFEITIDGASNAIDGKFLEKGEIITFPITEDSITRSGSKKAPHPICDELSYLAKSIDAEKNEIYMTVVRELLDYEAINNCENFRVIGKYILKNMILEDFLNLHLRGTPHSVDDKFILKYEDKDNKGKPRIMTMDLKKIFITFKLEKEYGGDIPITKDKGLHDFYIDYVRSKNSSVKELSYCDITGEMSYCVETHRGLLGTAKLVGVSNHKETYYGRFKKGKDIYRISYEASQKAHNMLKYLIENKNHSRYIGEGAYLINWLSQDLDKGGVELLLDIDNEDLYDMEDLEGVGQEQRDPLGGGVSDKLKRFFLGEDESFKSENDFHVLIIEKISNGRLSVKYHRRLSRSEAYERVMNWYRTTSWKFYGKDKSPSLYEIVHFIYGQENKNKFLSCEIKKLYRSSVERLIPCIIDGQRLPRDISRTAFYRLTNKQSYKYCWDKALSIGCSLIKKQKADYQDHHIDVDRISEVRQLKESRSFQYGKLMAIYEKIELDAIGGREGGGQKGKASTQRITNSDKLWSSMIRTPARTRFILESKIKPYMNMLKKNNYGSYIYHDRLITGITMELIRLEEFHGKKTGSLNENFILGYYHQKNALYQKRDKDAKKSDINSISELSEGEE